MLTFARQEKRPAPGFRRNSLPAPGGLGPVWHDNRAQVRHALRSPALQPKLTVSQPGDAYEREADRVADAVMRMAAPLPEKGQRPETLGAEHLQRDFAIPETGALQRMCTECQDEVQSAPEKKLLREPAEELPEEEEIFREPAQGLPEEEQIYREPAEEVLEEDEVNVLAAKGKPGHTPQVTPDLATGISTMRGGGGRPLTESSRTFFEPRFDRDFSNVRLHTDARAAGAAQAVNARAFTLGRDIFFGAGQFQPGTFTGKHLLAHELTHVGQLFRSFGERGKTIQRQKDKEEWQPVYIYKTEKLAKDQGKRRIKNKEATEYKVEKTTYEGKQAFQLFIKKGSGSSKKKTDKDEKSGGIVYLTFDDGPQNGTEVVLEVLAELGAPALFFLTGKNMEKQSGRQRSLVERMISDPKHQIGNHTFSHFPEKKKQYKKVYGNLSNSAKEKKFKLNYIKNKKHFQSMFKESSINFMGFEWARLPGDGRLGIKGNRDVYIEATEQLGMKHVGWKFEFATDGVFEKWVPKRDWKNIRHVDATYARFPLAGDIILFHDRHWKERKEPLRKTLKKLKEAGFNFGKL